MKMKTREITRRALDYAVALAEGQTPERRSVGEYWVDLGFGAWQPIEKYSCDFTGDDIIDRENICTWTNDGLLWRAWPAANMGQITTGTTRREAAMRCYVALKLGDEVEIPEELIK